MTPLLLFLAVCATATKANGAPVSRQTGVLFTGDATFYDPGLGDCGFTNTSADHVVEVSALFFDNFPGATADPSSNPLCGAVMLINYQGRSTTATVVDRCPGCGPSDIDLSPIAFNDLGDLGLGRLHQVQWEIL